MSGDVKPESRKAQVSSNGEQQEGVAPVVIQELSKSDPPKPPESKDVEYLTYEEGYLDKAIHTIKTMVLEDHDANPKTHRGPWIERCMGLNMKTQKLMMVKIPGKEYEVPPWEVMTYLGSVVSDRQSVHTETLNTRGGKRIGYCFDRFYRHNGKRYERCCWIPDRIHQAGLMYEKFIDPRSKEGIPIIAKISGTTNPKYEVIGAKEAGGTVEGYYRDLKRLYERHFLRRGEGATPEDEALHKLIHKINP